MGLSARERGSCVKPIASQKGTLPGAALAVLRDDTLGAKLARMGKHGQSILGDVFVQRDASFGVAQQARQGRLAVEEWKIAQILAIMLDQGEGIEDRGSGCLTTGQLLEP
jgi:hypothetical protein